MYVVRGDNFVSKTILSQWIIIIVILGTMKDGNGLEAQLQGINPTKIIPLDKHNVLLINNLETYKINNNNNNLHKKTIKTSFYTQTQNVNITSINSNKNNKNLINNNNNKIGINNLNKMENNTKINSSINQLLTTTGVNQSDLIMNFSTENSSIITYQVGSVALLPCSVQNIGEKMVVSWIRRKDFHLITVGSTTYSSDERFSAIHLQDSEDWTLQIKFVQVRDGGVYECQISTHPPTSIFVHLNVIEALADIPGPSEKFLKPGSTLRLSCKILKSMESPLYIFWYHNQRMINYDLHRGVNVSTDSDNRYSELLIAQTSVIHSGNYTCSPNNAVSASVLVHILNGENPAAMQHGEHGNGLFIFPSIKLIFLLIGFIIYFI